MLWGIAKRIGLHIDLKRDITCFDYSICSRLNSQISISAINYEGNRSNNDA